MRDIDFRGKHKLSGTWAYGYLDAGTLLSGEKKYFISNGAAPYDPVVVDPDTIGQYTGVTDRNGRRIYEGDIVVKRTYNGKKLFLVTFDGGMFHCGYGGGSSTAYHKYRLDEPSVAVVGNIHDNPEMITDGS